LPSIIIDVSGTNFSVKPEAYKPEESYSQ